MNFSFLTRTVAPTVDPVTVAEVKSQLRILHTEEDEEFLFLLKAATDWAEDYTSRSLLQQTWLAGFTGWPDIDKPWFQLAREPLMSVSSVKFYDADDVFTTVDPDDYVVDIRDATVRLRETFNRSLLSKNRNNPVEITFVAGYGDEAGDVPLRFKQAIRLSVASSYGDERSNGRTNVSFRAPSVAEKLLATLRIRPL